MTRMTLQPSAINLTSGLALGVIGGVVAVFGGIMLWVGLLLALIGAYQMIVGVYRLATAIGRPTHRRQHSPRSRVLQSL